MRSRGRQAPPPSCGRSWTLSTPGSGTSSRAGSLARPVQPSRVAIDFDREAQPPQLPPELEVPGHANQKAERDRHQPRVVRFEMALLMRDDQLLYLSRALRQPARHDDVRI